MQRKFTMVLCAILTLVLVLSVSAMAFATETDYVACNTSTNTMYEDVTVALAEATEGQTVKLLKDTSGAHVSVYDGSTLDLNGYTLTTNYFSGYGHIVDNSADNTGLLVPTRIMVDPNNAQLPVKDGEGYRFVEVLKFNAATQLDGSRYLFQPIFEEAAHAFLAAGAANSEVTIEVAVSWKDGEHTRIQRFVYSDNLVNGYIASYRGSNGGYGLAFGLTLENAANYTELSYDARVISGLNVVRSASNTNGAESENNMLTETVTIDHEQGNAVVAAGTLLESGTAELVLTATKLDETQSDITLGQDEELLSMDVHVEGISKDNTVPVIVTVNEMAPEFMNRGNITLYHVENGETVEMTRVYSLEEVDAHNEYYYDIETGTVTMALASFSEVAVVANTENAWNGNFDYSWYSNKPATKSTSSDYIIANADQLAGFGAIVGGMNGQTQDSFAGKTVKLVADINIGDTVSDNGKMFYPIGYYNSTGSYEKVSGGSVSSGFKTFEGTFDGNGHTIANFYQNTWEAFGDYNDGYSGTPNHNRDGFGLFGKVYGGTVKNLTVKNFQSDGEFASTGTIAAYADCGATFENITIFECNPRVYNIGNGGIVGCVGWYAQETAENPVTLKNITVDASNKISALWGSWDVACGGLVGQYYPTSGQDSSIKNAGIEMINCHVAAQIDVNNDVCANYQYYAYRYAGMLIGSVRKNETIDGRVYPNMNGITATGCTVTYGDWQNYYYCELIANSKASYTHDHQFSRLTLISAEADIKDESGNWSKTGNYMTLDGDTRTCYHIMKNEDGTLYRHVHDDENTEVVGGNTLVVEDHRCIYLPFDQLVTGYGWGVTSKGIGEIEGVEILNKTESSNKFTGTAAETYYTGAEVKIGELFEAAVSEDDILDANVQVIVSPTANEDGTVTSTAGATYTANTTDWTQGKLTFSGEGTATITISDYYYCKTTSIKVTILPDYSGRYYIATVRSSGNYFYMTSDLGTASTKRYQAEDSKSTTLPNEITNPDSNKIFVIEKDSNGAYLIYAEGITGDNYLGWASGNSGILVAKKNALTFTIDVSANKEGAVIIKTPERNLALNSSTGNNYFAFYETAQANQLCLIPVTGTVCTHENTTENIKNASCVEDGYVTVTCDDCDKTISTTAIPATGEHTYEYGICTGCGKEETPTEPTAEWKLVTDASELNAEDKIVIVASDYDYALSTTQNNNNRGQAAVTKKDDTVTFGDNVQIITLETGTTTGTFAFYTGSGYLYAASSTNNYLRTEETLSSNSSWTISITNTGVATVTAKGTNTRNLMQYNKGSSIFSSYSSEQATISIYKYAVNCDHTGSYTEKTVETTCTVDGYTCKVCSDCGQEFDIVAGESATGHSYNSVVTEPTCTEDGCTTYTCSACGDTYTETITATGHNYVDGVCSVCKEAKPEEGETKEETTTYTFSDYTAGTQYAENEEHILDDNVTVYTTQCHFTSELRIYSSSTHDGYAVIQSANPISAIAFNAGEKADTLNVYGSKDGATWRLISGVPVTSSYNDYTVDCSDAKYTYLKLDVAGSDQVRVKSITLTTLVSSDGEEECAHTNTTTTSTATCGKAGVETVTCDACHDVINKTDVEATGEHNYVGGVCSVCGDESTSGGETTTPVTEAMSIFGSTGTLSNKVITWTSGKVTFQNEQASSTTAIRTSDSDHYRVYGKSTVTISADGNISKIVITCTSSSYATALESSINDSDTVTVTATATASDSVVTITLKDSTASFTFTASAQIRLNKVEVTYTTAS